MVRCGVMRCGLIVGCVVVAVMAAASAPSMGQVPPDHGLDFVTVGAAGNRGSLPHERPQSFDPDTPYGSVPHEFRITRTEVSTEQWLGFVNAYAPFHSGAPRDSTWTSTFIDLGRNGRYEITDERARRFPVDIGWEYAARYCNWLTNDRVNEAWAFERGAYDTSTFTTNPDGSSNHQLSRSDGALYWIPAIDELLKAFYYDPNRYGNGAGGYWLYPQSSDAVPRIGPPTEGGTTNAGIEPEFRDLYFQVGSYPDATTPWGLLDASGGYSEWTESIAGDTFGRGRAAWGSSVGMGEGFMRQYDRFDFPQLPRPLRAPAGFRVASALPAPSIVSVALIVVGIGVRTRRRIQS